MQQAVERARALDRKLQASKQRLAEGSLTEADRQLEDVLSLDPGNAAAQQLRRQIREEVGRREQRQRLSEAVRHARDLWSQLRYGECITELVELQKEFPENAEIAKLLETARRDQAEAEKQKQLAEVRNMLASQQYEQARGALQRLRKDFPGDTAVENLLALAQDEQTAAGRQQELARLRALAGEGKHAEALAGAEALLGEFPGDFEVTELVNFARAEARKVEQERRLGEATRRVRDQMARGAFAQARQAAEKALKQFPESAELKALGEEANQKQQEKERGEQLEKRLREVQTRIERDELTDAIELAQETLATLGPDTHVTGLLEAARKERQDREKKKEQGRKIDDAQTLLGAGKLNEATQIVDEALATKLLDAADPRVKTFLAEAESQRQKASVVTPPPAEPAEAAPPTSFSATAISTPTEPKAEPKPRVEPKPKAAPKPKPAAPAAKMREPAAPQPSGKGNKMPLIAAAAVAIIAVVGGGIYFATSRGKASSPSSVAQAPAPTSNPSASTAAPTPAASTPAPTPAPNPPPNPLEAQQRQLMAQAQTLAAQGQFTQALAALDKAGKLNGPLGTNIQSLRSQIAKAESNSEAQAALQKEGQLWTQAVAAYNKNHLDTAARDFQQVAAMKTGLHQADARKYLDTLIPQARKSDTLFSRAQALAKNVNSPQSLTQANQDLEQVIHGGGPRAAQAARLQASVKLLLNASASNQLQQLIKQYNSGTDKTSQLETLQQEFRKLENVSGTVGQQARFMDQRIGADLKELRSSASQPPPLAAPHKNTAKASALPRLLWLVSLDSSSVSGEQIEKHPISYDLVSKASASHDHFELQVSIDAQGRVTAGRLLSGTASLGQAILDQAKKSWRFSPPGQSSASANVSLQF